MPAKQYECVMCHTTLGENHRLRSELRQSRAENDRTGKKLALAMNQLAAQAARIEKLRQLAKDLAYQ